eukprot:g33696.t1
MTQLTETSHIQRQAPYGDFQTRIQSRARIAQYLPYLSTYFLNEKGVIMVLFVGAVRMDSRAGFPIGETHTVRAPIYICI